MNKLKSYFLTVNQSHLTWAAPHYYLTPNKNLSFLRKTDTVSDLQHTNSFGDTSCTGFFFKLGGCTQVRLFGFTSLLESFSQEPNQLNEQSHIRALEFKSTSRSWGRLVKARSSMDATALFDKSNSVRLVRPENAFLVMCAILLPARKSFWRLLSGLNAPFVFSTSHEMEL